MSLSRFLLPSERLVLILAATLMPPALCAAEAESGAGAAVYLCPGNVYQDSPCKGGRSVDVSPAATLPAETRSFVPSADSASSGPYVGGIPNGREQGFSESMTAPVPQWPRRPYGHAHPYSHPHPRPYGPGLGAPYGPGLPPPGPGHGYPPSVRPIDPMPAQPVAPPPRPPAPGRYYYPRP